MNVGYCRVSSRGQDLSVQLEQLKDCEKIFQEVKSGRTDEREQLKLCLDFVREGDCLVCSRLDRISRSVKDLMNILSYLEKKGVSFRCTEQNIETKTPEGRLMIGLLATIAEFENDLRRSRIIDGIEMAVLKGRKLGRRRLLSQDEEKRMRTLRAEGKKIRELEAEFCVSRATVYNVLSH